DYRSLRGRIRIDGVFVRHEALNLKCPLGIRRLSAGAPSACHTSVSYDGAIENRNSFGRSSGVGVHNTPADFVSLLYRNPGNIHIRGFKALLNHDRVGLRWVGDARVESFRI